MFELGEVFHFLGARLRREVVAKVDALLRSPPNASANFIENEFEFKNLMVRIYHRA